MIDTLVQLAHDAMTSPWAYLALFAFAALDAFLPIIPSESLVITAGVFAAGGEPELLGVIGAAALGAFVGDHVSYLIGRTAGARLLERARSRPRGCAAFEFADRALARRGGLILVVARYVPGGRTAVTLTMGATHYPLRSFSSFDSIAALSWAVYSALVGYVGGRAFEQDTIKGLLVGLGLGLTIAVVVETIRRLRGRSLVFRPRAPGSKHDS
ncbi:MAG: DedA family protein [Solirubrobacterales bacterium]|nr:DedA family protein [Solirubrobacterales bacterium]